MPNETRNTKSVAPSFVPLVVEVQLETLVAEYDILCNSVTRQKQQKQQQQQHRKKLYVNLVVNRGKNRCKAEQNKQ